MQPTVLKLESEVPVTRHLDNDHGGATSTHGGHEHLLDAASRLRREVSKRIVGQRDVIDEILMAMLAGGHALLVGVPGLAKTLMISSIAQAMKVEFRRIQFTPDLAPSDITGTELLEEDGTTGARRLRFARGPIFANIILADEINRTPPRTQAAMLEAMQERHVTAAGETMPLPRPFFVLATQNPIEQEGTYPLPEAQLDRFLFNIWIGYPSEEDEVEILRSTTHAEAEPLTSVLDGDRMIAMQRAVRDLPASDAALRYAAAIVRATRPQETAAPALVKQHVRWGAGPRAGQALVLGAKAHALLHGRYTIGPQDIQRVALPVLRHRVLLTFAAEAEGVTPETVVRALLEHVPTPSSNLTI